MNTNLRSLDDALDVTTEECCFVEVSSGDCGDRSGKRKTVVILGLLSDDPGLYRPGAFGGATSIVTNGIWGLESPASAIERVMEENAVARDADLIVPLTHMDMTEDVRLAERFGPGGEEDCDGDDDVGCGIFPFIIGGHDHDVFDEMHNGCRILKSGADAHRASVVECAWREASVPAESWKEVETSNSHMDTKYPSVSVRWIEAKDYEPHPEVQALVDDRRRVLHELETARLFRISEMLETMRGWGESLRPDEKPDPKFSTRRNRFRTTGVCTALCSVIRRGLPADCCVLNAGGVRWNANYEAKDGGWFTYADLKSETPFPDPGGVMSMPGRVLEQAVGYSRKVSRLEPPEEDSGLLHLCDMVRYAYDGEEDLDGHIVDIGRWPFTPEQVYNVALPITLLNGMDKNMPLLEWARDSGLRISEDAGKPVKVILVMSLALVHPSTQDTPRRAPAFGTIDEA